MSFLVRWQQALVLQARKKITMPRDCVAKVSHTNDTLPLSQSDGRVTCYYRWRPMDRSRPKDRAALRAKNMTRRSWFWSEGGRTPKR